MPKDAIQQAQVTESSTDGLIIGYAESPSIATPAIVGVIEASRSADLFSWLSTFAPEAFPISQSFRVISLADWQAGISVLSPRTLFAKDAIWPSLILGEIIGQGEREQNISSIPLSRVFASFTYAQARACLLYEKHPALISECQNRLLLLEADATFVKRPIGVGELASMWEVANGCGDVAHLEIVRFVAGVLDNEPHEKSQTLPVIFQTLQLSQELIKSDSIEQRVLEFERVVARLGSLKQPGFNAALAIAALAILVGRNTTHITLLEEYAHEYPTAVCWFGLLAGMVGPAIWDEKWLRLSTSIERLLRTTATLADPTTADLCWIEYSWIRGLRQSSVWMKETPKLYPRVLSVEILPGVSCQLRLQDSGQTATRASAISSAAQAPAPVAKYFASDSNGSASSSALVDASRATRMKLFAEMKSELSRMTETIAKLEREESQQGQLFDNAPPVDIMKKPETSRKPGKKAPAKKAPRKSG
ncbi:hypothetical protein [Burkholderia stagnalis]|uniref:hypothetical protein n=1 Tax=Burkholderia stagnalis TaxID=1503054 RepID=UPI000F5AF1A6|nr:hypothetical protein [Burkholderia stagnalis]